MILIFSSALICSIIVLSYKPLLNFIDDLKDILKVIWFYVRPFLNWRFLISYSIPFMLINGWAWIGTFLFPYYKNWFTITSVSWMAFLWAPFTPEKLVTIPIAIWIHTKLFKKDLKTKMMLEKMYEKAKKKEA